MPYKDKVKQREAQRNYARKHSKKYSATFAEKRKKLRAYVDSTKVGKQCACGETSTLEYHHKNQDNKTISVAYAVGQRWSKERIDEEISKCELWCRNCHRSKHRKLRTSTKAQQISRQNKSDIINEYKKKNGCSKCIESDPFLLDFHHRDPKDKFKCISRMVSQGYGLERIFEEIEKCDLLCGNCHHKYHYG